MRSRISWSGNDTQFGEQNMVVSGGWWKKQKAATLVGEERALVEALAARSAAVGEPWLSFFTPEELEVHLIQVGFKEVIHFAPHNATERYLTGCTDQLRLPGYFHMIDARVS
jgi:hypothetical protein